MGPGTTWYFRRFAVARPRLKMEGGPKCNEPQGPVFFEEKNGWAQWNGGTPSILAGERARVMRRKPVLKNGARRPLL